jgi:hypothetical protein
MSASNERLPRPDKPSGASDQAFRHEVPGVCYAICTAEAGSFSVSRYDARRDSSPEHFRGSSPPRRLDFARSASVAYEFVHFGLENREPETFRGARFLDARRDNPASPPRRSARQSATPPRYPTTRDLRARNSLSQKAVSTPQNANAPAGGPGRSLKTVGRASIARARQFHAAFGR